MKRFLVLAMLFAIVSAFSWGQESVRFSRLVASPADYIGKEVRFHAQILNSFRFGEGDVLTGYLVDAQNHSKHTFDPPAENQIAAVFTKRMKDMILDEFEAQGDQDGLLLGADFLGNVENGAVYVGGYPQRGPVVSISQVLFTTTTGKVYRTIW